MGKVDLYKLSRSFELAVLHHLVLTQSFWTRVGQAVEADEAERMNLEIFRHPRCRAGGPGARARRGRGRG